MTVGFFAGQSGFGKVLRCSIAIFQMVLVLGCASATQDRVPAAQASPQAVDGDVSPADARQLEEKFGIEIVALRTTAAGRMLDLRFKVLDKDRAMPFFLKELKPHLIDEKTGAVLEVPVPAKGGPMRPTSRDPRVGVTYFMLFANPGGFVTPGKEMTLAVGEHRIQGLVVE